MRTHRVGTVTLGVSMIGLGILYIIGYFTQLSACRLIFRAWPAIFILLGIEILWSNARTKKVQFVYDTTSIILIVILTAFAMFLALIGLAFEYSFLNGYAPNWY